MGIESFNIDTEPVDHAIVAGFDDGTHALEQMSKQYKANGLSEVPTDLSSILDALVTLGKDRSQEFPDQSVSDETLSSYHQGIVNAGISYKEGAKV